MALTIEQIQENITNKDDIRQIINQLADYVQANPGGGSPGGTSILSATVELTDAQIKALEGSPIEIVAAQVGKIIMPSLALLSSNCLSDYTNINANSKIRVLASGGSAYMEAYNQTDGAVTLLLAPTANLGDTKAFQFITPSQTTTAVSNTQTGGFTNLTSEYENRNLLLGFTNSGGGVLTGGNAANTLKVTVYYVVVDL